MSANTSTLAWLVVGVPVFHDSDCCYGASSFFFWRHTCVNPSVFKFLFYFPFLHTRSLWAKAGTKLGRSSRALLKVTKQLYRWEKRKTERNICSTYLAIAKEIVASKFSRENCGVNRHTCETELHQKAVGHRWPHTLEALLILPLWPGRPL